MVITKRLLYTIIFGFGLLLGVLGCNVATTIVVTATPLPVTLPPTATEKPVESATPTLTATATQRPPETAIPTACVVRADWPLYTVIAGDTLAVIASRVSSTVNALAAANCLANPNSISVGQSLRVPQLPVTPTDPAPAAKIVSFYLNSGYPPQLLWQTENVSQVVLYVSDSTGDNRLLGTYPANGAVPLPATSGVATFRLNIRDLNGQTVIGTNGLPVSAIAETSGGPVDPPEPECPIPDTFGSGQIVVSPVDGVWSNCVFLNPNQTVTITWDGMPSTINRVEYYFIAVSGTCGGIAPGNPGVIGSDTNLADGSGMNWFLNIGPCAGVLYAFGYPGTGLIQSPQLPVVIR